MNDMKILENIGSSRFGRTFLATINNEECALIIQIKDNTKPLSNQICVYSHPFLVKTLYVCQDKSKIFYLFRQIKGIPFLDFMQNRRESHDLSPKNLEEVMKFYMAQIFSALECLERWGHVERAFKPDDIMITEEGNVCMTIMYDLESEMDLSFDLASPIYLPPETSNREETLQSLKDNTENNSETIQNLTKNDRKAIWWSLGVFMFVCLTGKQPLNENDRKKIKVKYPNNLSSECRDLLKQLMEKDVDKRLSTIPDLKKHPFFAQVDWDTIHQIEQEIHKPPMKPTPTEIERFTAIRKAKFNIQQSETPSNEPSNLVAPDAHSGLSPGFSTFTKDKT
uniref:Protein kinase domain-containing protein n=1 Tax=Arcella intermedia TaxID=1963864 RepID=A0A6B2L7E1_9EUKA